MVLLICFFTNQSVNDLLFLNMACSKAISPCQCACEQKDHRFLQSSHSGIYFQSNLSAWELCSLNL